MSNHDFSSRITVKEHKGKEILYLDFSGVTDEAIALEFIQFRHEHILGLNAAPKSLLVCADVTGAIQSPKVIDALKKSNKITNEFIARTSAVGVSGFKRALIKIINKFNNSNIHAFATAEEAMDYLVAED